MTEPEFSRVYGPADHQNTMLPLALGAIAMLDTFAEAASQAAPDPAGMPADDTLLAAGLGLLSLRRTLRRWASHAAGDHAPAPPQPSAAPAPPPQILR